MNKKMNKKVGGSNMFYRIALSDRDLYTSVWGTVGGDQIVGTFRD